MLTYLGLRITSSGFVLQPTTFIKFFGFFLLIKNNFPIFLLRVITTSKSYEKSNLMMANAVKLNNKGFKNLREK